MNKTFFLVLLAVVSHFSLAQAQHTSKSPYATDWKDGLITGAFAGGSYWGLTLLNNKEGLSEEELNRIAEDPEAAKQGVPRIDRWTAGNFSQAWIDFSDYPFYASFGLPLLFLAEKDTRQNFGQIGLLYVETMAIAGTIFTQTAGRTYRNRPLVYYSGTDPQAQDDRSSRNNENSFFAGHTTATAAATFFTAKVFHDFFPDSPARPYVWAGAAIVPAAVGLGRLKGGKHFFSDNLIGYTVGAGLGILVPHLHKISEQNDRLTLVPVGGFGYNGFALDYRF